MSYSRNKERVLPVMKTRSDNSVIVTQACTLHVPVRFKDIGLASIGSSVYVFGLFPIILDSGHYAVMNVNALIELGQFTTTTTTIDEIDYYVFRFEEGSVLFKTLDVVQRSSVVFSALNEFVFMGKIPWYVGYDDVGGLLETARSYGGSKASIVSGIMEFMAAYIARDKRDRTKFIRETAKSEADFQKYLAWVPMKSVFWSAPGTVNKIAGAYAQDGIVAALVNPNDTVPRVEAVLRA